MVRDIHDIPWVSDGSLPAGWSDDDVTWLHSELTYAALKTTDGTRFVWSAVESDDPELADFPLFYEDEGLVSIVRLARNGFRKPFAVVTSTTRFPRWESDWWDHEGPHIGGYRPVTLGTPDDVRYWTMITDESSALLLDRVRFLLSVGADRDADACYYAYADDTVTYVNVFRIPEGAIAHVGGDLWRLSKPWKTRWQDMEWTHAATGRVIGMSEMRDLFEHTPGSTITGLPEADMELIRMINRPLRFSR